jgi:hypothetical protein
MGVRVVASFQPLGSKGPTNSREHRAKDSADHDACDAAPRKPRVLDDCSADEDAPDGIGLVATILTIAVYGSALVGATQGLLTALFLPRVIDLDVD